MPRRSRQVTFTCNKCGEGAEHCTMHAHVVASQNVYQPSQMLLAWPPTLVFTNVLSALEGSQRHM